VLDRFLLYPYTMMTSHKTLFGSSVVVLLGCGLSSFGCAKPDEQFNKFDERVLDAGKRDIASGCNGGAIPDVNGEFYFSLSPVVAQESFLELIATTELDLTVDPAQLTLTLQPLCSQADQCTVGQPVGATSVIPDITVDSECSFTVDIPSIIIPGGANTLSGAEIDGNLELIGNLQSDDFYCGVVNGIATVGGAPIPIDNSTFGAVRITPGTLGDALPTAIAICPDATPDAGV